MNNKSHSQKNGPGGLPRRPKGGARSLPVHNNGSTTHNSASRLAPGYASPASSGITSAIRSETRKAILDMVQCNVSFQDIITETGVDPNTLRRLYAALNVPVLNSIVPLPTPPVQPPPMASNFGIMKLNSNEHLADKVDIAQAAESIRKQLEKEKRDKERREAEAKAAELVRQREAAKEAEEKQRRSFEIQAAREAFQKRLASLNLNKTSTPSVPPTPISSTPVHAAVTQAHPQPILPAIPGISLLQIPGLLLHRAGVTNNVPSVPGDVIMKDAPIVTPAQPVSPKSDVAMTPTESQTDSSNAARRKRPNASDLYSENNVAKRKFGAQKPHAVIIEVSDDEDDDYDPAKMPFATDYRSSDATPVGTPGINGNGSYPGIKRSGTTPMPPNGAMDAKTLAAKQSAAALEIARLKAAIQKKEQQKKNGTGSGFPTPVQTPSIGAGPTVPPPQKASPKPTAAKSSPITEAILAKEPVCIASPAQVPQASLVETVQEKRAREIAELKATLQRAENVRREKKEAAEAKRRQATEAAKRQEEEAAKKREEEVRKLEEEKRKQEQETRKQAEETMKQVEAARKQQAEAVKLQEETAKQLEREREQARERKRNQLEAIEQAREVKRQAREKLQEERERMRKQEEEFRRQEEEMLREDQEMEEMRISLAKELESFCDLTLSQPASNPTTPSVATPQIGQASEGPATVVDEPIDVEQEDAMDVANTASSASPAIATPASPPGSDICQATESHEDQTNEDVVKATSSFESISVDSESASDSGDMLMDIDDEEPEQPAVPKEVINIADNSSEQHPNVQQPPPETIEIADDLSDYEDSSSSSSSSEDESEEDSHDDSEDDQDEDDRTDISSHHHQEPELSGLARTPTVPIPKTSSRAQNKQTTMPSLIAHPPQQETAIESADKAKTIPNVFTPYVSPLAIFKSFRHHPRFLEFNPSGYRSLRYSSRLDENKMMCRWELSSGVCNDNTCRDQHFREIVMQDDEILMELAENEGTNKDEEDEYAEGLRNTIMSFKETGVIDFAQVAMGISAFRRRFFGDETRIVKLPGSGKA
ncbi:hypothetical protein FPQ18DRAFT_144791 [Pyronema domesticum]|nr:hypothetical protein FPQ18DRAFT_144791 [Pyronema domesticum]